MNLNKKLFLAITGTLAAVALAPACGGPPDPAFPEPQTTALRTTTEEVDASVGLPPADAAPAKRPIGDDPTQGLTSKAFDQYRTKCDDKGPLATCPPDHTVYPTSESCNKNEFAKGRCPLINKAYKPKVAQAAWRCFATHPMKQTCGYYESLQCVHGALMDACPDQSVTASCQAISDQCDGVEHSRCLSYMSGMTDEGRKELVACITKSCMSFLECAAHIITPRQ